MGVNWLSSSDVDIDIEKYDEYEEYEEYEDYEEYENYEKNELKVPPS